MVPHARKTSRKLAWVGTGLTLALIGGCHTPLVPSYAYFTSPPPDDAWSRKIHGWQERERASETRIASAATRSVFAEPPVDEADVAARDLREKYDVFRDHSRRLLARELAVWIQEQARDHYVPDGAVDHWATLEETFRENGDDCDGLELLAFNFLRELGFREDEVFRAIVVRRSDGQHHMVTLWFENPEDPWVIDPTGAMTTGMPRMSELPEWVPLKVFTVDEDYSVKDLNLISAAR
jgi:hypothetical protein